MEEEIIVKKDDNGTSELVDKDPKSVHRQVADAMDIFDDLFDEMVWRNSGGSTF